MLALMKLEILLSNDVFHECYEQQCIYVVVE